MFGKLSATMLRKLQEFSRVPYSVLCLALRSEISVCRFAFSFLFATFGQQIKTAVVLYLKFFFWQSLLSLLCTSSVLWPLFLPLVLSSIAKKRSDTHPLFSFHPPSLSRFITLLHGALAQFSAGLTTMLVTRVLILVMNGRAGTWPLAGL